MARNVSAGRCVLVAPGAGAWLLFRHVRPAVLGQGWDIWNSIASPAPSPPLAHSSHDVWWPAPAQAITSQAVSQGYQAGRAVTYSSWGETFLRDASLDHTSLKNVNEGFSRRRSVLTSIYLTRRVCYLLYNWDSTCGLIKSSWCFLKLKQCH